MDVCELENGLNVWVEDLSEVEKNIQILIPRERYNIRFDQELSKTARNVKLKGFRPGKVPRELVNKMYGSQMRADILFDFVQKACESAISDNALNVVGSWAINVPEVDESEELRVTVTVSLFPEPNIENYVGGEIDIELMEFSDSRVEDEIQGRLDKYAKFEPVSDRNVVEDGDYLRVNWEIIPIDGEPLPPSQDGVEESSNSGQGVIVHLGSDPLAPEISCGLIGALMGEVKEVTVSRSNDKLSNGQGDDSVFELPNPEEPTEVVKVTYRITVTEILSKNVPAFDDCMAKELALGDTVEEARQKITELVHHYVDGVNRDRKEYLLLERIFERNPFKIPQNLIDDEIRSMLAKRGFLDPNKKETWSRDVTMLRDKLGQQAEWQVRRLIVTGQLFKQESIDVTDDEVSDWLVNNGPHDVISRFNKASSSEAKKLLDSIKFGVASVKLFDSLMERTSFIDKTKGDSNVNS